MAMVSSGESWKSAVVGEAGLTGHKKLMKTFDILLRAMLQKVVGIRKTRPGSISWKPSLYVAESKKCPHVRPLF